MKLLFDQNLSDQLLKKCSDIFPGSNHLKRLSLEKAGDSKIWEFAKAGGFTIVTKDSDFSHMAMRLQAPPKVIWIQIGNCSTELAAKVLRRDHELILAFEADKQAALFSIIS